MQSILGNARKPDISFRADGRVDISAFVSNTLRLKSGDVIDIMTEGREFYLYVRCRAPMPGRYGAKVSRTNKRGNHFRSSSHKLSLAILSECGAKNKVCLCVGEPLKHSSYGIMIPIITKNIIQND